MKRPLNDYADYADYADTSAPIDLPDDFGTDAETDGDGVIGWLALALFIVLAIAAALIFWSIP